MKLGVLGPGRIADGVAHTLTAMPEIECYAVASRTSGKAAAFAEKFGFQKAYTGYETMLSDPEVELVYITTPHSHHYEHMKLCLEYGKHVICEKAFTMNAKQAKKVREFAAQKGLYHECCPGQGSPGTGGTEGAVCGGSYLDPIYAFPADH